MVTQWIAAAAIIATGAQGTSSPVETGLGWLRSAWSSVEKQGRPAAERAVREAPKFFKALPGKVTSIQKQASKQFAAMELDQKRDLVLELWRVRQSLNLMALLDPELLEQMTGIDAKVLKTAIATANKLYATLAKSLP